MKEIYDWVPWFKELAEKIAEGGEKYLIEKAKQVEWKYKKPDLLGFGDENIDPFSFFYFLASKNTSNQRKTVYSSVRDVFEIESSLPDTSIKDYYIFPTPDPRFNLLFYDSKISNPDLLWRLFKQAVEDDPKIKPNDFKKVLEITYVGVTKLTQTLFLINPEYFLPVDDSTGIVSEAILQIDIDKVKNRMIKENGLQEYLSVLENLKKAFPRCRPYEINIFLWLQKSKQIIKKADSKFFQISTNVYDDGTDNWDNFEKNNWVYTGGPGSGKSWGKEGDYPLTEPERGDIILVRTGLKKGRAIGIVKKNDYAELGPLKNSRIHVLWINKSKHSLYGQTEQFAFRETKPGSSTYSAFEKTEGYVPSFDLIKKLTGNFSENDSELDPIRQQPGVKHPLNQILYGPPGTGKTWNTVNYAVAIIKRKSLHEVESEDREGVKRRFNELKASGQIAMVTFHQNFAYEDFIEGIRPVLAGDESKNVEYELSKGVFREIADRARDDREQNYVLIIDEINRGNIAKIFGELITLIEPSKRLRQDDEASVTLPYSKEEFGVPHNLYIIGTMNTADRSIALLDTALRRRFEFVEMMPNSSHDLISTAIEGVNCQQLLAAMNKRIRVLLDREHQIGHTYFIGVDNMDALAATFKTKIIPLLQEYFYDHWEKIDLVLNRNEFIREIPVESDLFKNSVLIDEQRKIYELSDDDKWKSPGSYRAIYEKEQGDANETEQDT